MPEFPSQQLSTIAEVRASNVDKKMNPGEQAVCLCNYMDVYSNDYIVEGLPFMEATATVDEIQRFKVEKGDVLMTKDSESPDDIGIPTVVIDEINRLVCGYHVALIKPDKSVIDPVYLAKQLASSSAAKRYSRLANGSTRYGLSYKSIADTPIPLPPIPYQQRIAEILSTVDEAVEQTEALIAKTQRIKAGLMHNLFTRGVTLDGQLRPPREEAPQLYKETPLGWIPKEWEVVPLKSEISISHGYAFSGDWFFDSPPGGVLLTPGNFHRNGGLYFNSANTKYFRGEVPESTVLRRGEMVTVMTDLSPQTLILGRFAIIDTDSPVLHNQRIGLVRLKQSNKWNRGFLCAALGNERLRRVIIRNATGTTVRHTSPERILSVDIARPSVEEQAQSLVGINAIEERIESSYMELRKLIALKRGLMADLLSGKVVVSISHLDGVVG